MESVAECCAAAALVASAFICYAASEFKLPAPGRDQRARERVWRQRCAVRGGAGPREERGRDGGRRGGERLRGRICLWKNPILICPSGASGSEEVPSARSLSRTR